MRVVLVIVLLSLFGIGFTPLHATHIIGGYMRYEQLGQAPNGEDSFRIILTVYRDCFGGQAPFDNPAPIAIYRTGVAGGQPFRTFQVNRGPIVQIQPTIDNPCLVIPPQVCTEEASYTFITTLPASTTGYTVVYQRCCRNGTIQNIQNPGSTGASFFVQIPPTGLVPFNSSPDFDSFPPIAICVNEPMIVDQSVTDQDGDSLVYRFCASFAGGSQGNPAPNPPTRPPYNPIVFSPPFSATNPLPANPALQIDSLTGIVTGTPNVQGQYVVGICIDEYRNGVLIGSYVRDFQFNVLFCPDVALIEPLPDTTLLCAPFTITFGNNSSNANNYSWNFGDPTTTNDTSTLFEPTWTYPAIGTYTVTLIATNNDGCTDTSTQVLNIKQAVTADFDYVRACPGSPVQFWDSSETFIGPIVRWEWTFGDGSTSQLQNPLKTYAGTGPYTVRLRIVTSDSCVVTRQRTVTFYTVPTASFTTSTQCSNQPITFTSTSTVPNGSITGWAWEFGDGTADTGAIASKLYSTPGTYTAQLVVTSNNGCKDTIAKTINIPTPLVAVADGDTSVCAGRPAQLSASGGTTYRWSPATGLNNRNIANPVARPQANTVYTVVVSDSCYTDTAFVTVLLLPAPTPDFTVDLACVGDTLRFTDTSTDSFGLNMVGWNWTFGDGTTSIQQNPLKIYNSDGPFTVTLQVTNDTGCVNTITKQVKPFPLPDVNFRIDTTPCLNLPTIFTDISTTDSGSIVFRNWSFGDGTGAGNVPVAQKIYSIPGTYTVTLRVTNSLGCTDSVSKIVTITPEPLASVGPDQIICPDDSAQLSAAGGLFYRWFPPIGLDDPTSATPLASPPATVTYTVVVSDSCFADSATVTVTVKPKPVAAFSTSDDCVNDTTFFTDLSTSLGAINSWNWDFGDGSTSGDSDPIKVYLANGTYDVTLIVGNDSGCTDTITQAITPRPIADSDFSFDTLGCLGEPVQFVDLSTLVTGTIVDWTWQFGDGGTSNQQNPQHIYNLPGTYTVLLITTTDAGCIDTMERVLDIVPAVTALVTPDTSICSLDVALLTASGGLYYSWEPTSLIIGRSDSAVVQVQPQTPTVFTVTVSDDCSADQATVSIDFLPWPVVQAVEDTAIYKGELATITALVGPDVNQFLWQPTATIEGTSDSTDQTIDVRPDTVTWYTVLVTDDNGCRNVDSVLITFLGPRVAVPNAFTPNGDNLNDVFYLITRGEVELLDFSIYNRWGQRVFQTTGIATDQNGWDGTFRGEPQPSGNYAYVIRYVATLPGSEPELTNGSVTLIR